MLNKDQQIALNQIINWWNGSQMYYILDGAGGMGKTFLIDEILKQLRKCSPIILAPTHESLKQVKDKVTGDYIYKTVHSALGMSPTMSEKDLKFEHIALPAIWEDVNLAICDEASMYSDWMLNLLTSTKVKLLFIGHKSQLPPVEVRRKIFDKCISPVFDKNYPTSTLTIPMRNTGKLFQFNNHLEQMIYNEDRVIPLIFDIKKADLKQYIHSKEGIEDFLLGNTKIAMWSNNGVDRYNQKLRKVLFGDKEAAENKYIKGDKIILTAPLTAVENLEKCNEIILKKIMGATGLDTFYTNSKAEVISTEKCSIILNKHLLICCYKILVSCEGKTAYFFEPIDEQDFEKISSYYERIAWTFSNKSAKIKAYRQRHFIMSCFAKIKHYYAATTYRLQGATIDNIIVINNDIAKVANMIEQKKHRYVACSRAKNNLMFFRGI
jgi:ATP-dependent exoDNAse (exonuclease V) alpha subunit